MDHSIYGQEKPTPMTRRQLLESYRLYLEDTHGDGASASWRGSSLEAHVGKGHSKRDISLYVDSDRRSSFIV